MNGAISAIPVFALRQLSMIIGTAGHVDHGKTALVRVLTGVDADRLPEEKRRGMTIDLGFAYRPLGPDGGVLGFIDVPGHQRFLHNMLAGATGIDFVLLVVAADDGPMPQTCEHLEVVSLLGVERGAVALTKTDLVSPDRLRAATIETRALLARSALCGAAIIPVSSITGEGIAELEAHLSAAARLLPAARPAGAFRMAVDRSFVLSGIGVVVTGTIAAGRISVGERAVLTPAGLEARIRSIHANGRPALSGQAGERCAVNITGAQIDRGRVRRGDWLVAAPLHAPTERLDARVRIGAPLSQDLRPGTLVHLHIGAARTPARLMPLEGRGLQPGPETLVQLRLDHSIGAWRGDRFILRNASATCTVGGGVVLDPHPPERGRRRPERIAALAALAEPEPARALRQLVEVSTAGVDLGQFARASGLTPAETQTAADQAAARVLKADRHDHGFALSPGRFAAWRRELSALLAQHHQIAPDSPGLIADQLRLRLRDRLPPKLFQAVLQTLAAEGALAVSGVTVHLSGHGAVLPPADADLWAQIRPRLQTGGFAAVWVRDLARELSIPESAMRRLMKRLARRGEVVEVAPDRFYCRQTVVAMAGVAAEMCAAADGTITAAAFRDRIGTGRKLAIVVLEFFDRTGITIRRGDFRTVQPDRVQFFAGSAP